MRTLVAESNLSATLESIFEVRTTITGVTEKRSRRSRKVLFLQFSSNPKTSHTLVQGVVLHILANG